VAVQLKTEPWEFYDGLFDDTCLNGVRFFCGTPGTSDYKAVLTSTVGDLGKWGKVFTCNGDGYMVGFMMRTVEQGTPLTDETAANNMRIMCAGSSSGFMELDGEGWGEWTNPRICEQTEYVCGLQTQVEPPQGASKSIEFLNNKIIVFQLVIRLHGVVCCLSTGVDDTGLNNIRVECCDL
jgi:hypothetical protein